ncbi:hypothetical protein IW261DRAFT_1635748 [Armillaria novae-zelandiae]|uniref:Uncharacterized protein n=1 Tax=Armillaria novae-zelandiae TaxID=153914 RepID=A0AA39P3X1_9AGAR|nr:hypothetical protein IW261DRAFT_1635748 [Armillaria novae-zelandiae]
MTSYCDSASWMQREFLTSSSTNTSSKQSSCFTEGNCITAADSAAIISFHLEHIKFMVNLVEGTGLPPGRYFDFKNSLHHDTGKYAISTDSNLEADEDHKFERAIKSLKRAAEQEALMETANTRRQEKYAIKVNNILQPSLDRFFADIRVAFSNLANGVPPIIEFFTNISSYGHLYNEFLSKDAATIWTLAEHTSIFHNHFTALMHYFIWYANHPVMSVVDVKARLDLDYHGADLSPHWVIGSHLSLPANEDPFVDHCVDEDGWQSVKYRPKIMMCLVVPRGNNLMDFPQTWAAVGLSVFNPNQTKAEWNRGFQGVFRKRIALAAEAWEEAGNLVQIDHQDWTPGRAGMQGPRDISRKWNGVQEPLLRCDKLEICVITERSSAQGDSIRANWHLM